jgi:hypothetical protein
VHGYYFVILCNIPGLQNGNYVLQYYCSLSEQIKLTDWTVHNMLDKNSAIVQEQIKDNIIDITKVEYACAFTSRYLDARLCDPYFGFGKLTTYICDRRWHSSISPVKGSIASRKKYEAERLAELQRQIAENDFHDSQGSAGPETFRPASFWAEYAKDQVAELTSEEHRWFIVYHDDKYVYDYDTKQPIKLDQTPWITTDTTIFN